MMILIVIPKTPEPPHHMRSGKKKHFRRDS